jgi:hypothetical protein
LGRAGERTSLTDNDGRRSNFGFDGRPMTTEIWVSGS